MEIENASTTPSKSNKLRNVNTVRWESWNLTTQPWEINDRKSEVIAFVVNAGMNVTTNNFLCLKYLLYSTEVQLDIYREYVSQIQGYRW